MKQSGHKYRFLALCLVLLSLIGGWGVSWYADAQIVPTEKVDDNQTDDGQEHPQDILKAYSAEAVVPMALDLSPAICQFIPVITFEELAQAPTPLPKATIVLSYFSKLFSSSIRINAP